MYTKAARTSLLFFCLKFVFISRCLKKENATFKCSLLSCLKLYVECCTIGMHTNKNSNVGKYKVYTFTKQKDTS